MRVLGKRRYTFLDMCPKTEAKLMKEKNGRDQNPLGDLVDMKMRIAGDSRASVARLLGISQGHLSQLLLGHKRFSGLGNDTLRRCAAYAGLPVVTCMLLAGKLEAADFYEPTPEHLRMSAVALQSVAQSREAQECRVGIGDLEPLPAVVKRFIIHLYEEAAGVQLIRRHLSQEMLDEATKVRLPFEVRVSKAR